MEKKVNKNFGFSIIINIYNKEHAFSRVVIPSAKAAHDFTVCIYGRE